MAHNKKGWKKPPLTFPFDKNCRVAGPILTQIMSLVVAELWQSQKCDLFPRETDIFIFFPLFQAALAITASLFHIFLGAG